MEVFEILKQLHEKNNLTQEESESTLNFYKKNGFEIDTKHSFLKKL